MNNDKVLELAIKVYAETHGGMALVPDESYKRYLLAFAQALNEHRGEPLLYVRMRDGEVDWSEDCVSPDTSCGDSYELEEGYTAVPLYAAPVTPVGDEVDADFKSMFWRQVERTENL